MTPGSLVAGGFPAGSLITPSGISTGANWNAVWAFKFTCIIVCLQ